MSLTAWHIKIIHTAKNKLGLDEDTYRAMLANVCGVQSSKELDPAGFATLMEHLKGLGFQPTYHAPCAGNKPRIVDPDSDLVSPQQQRFIGWLMDQVGFDTAERRRGFCERQIHKPWPQGKDEANTVVESLKRMQNRGWKAAGKKGGGHGRPGQSARG